MIAVLAVALVFGIATTLYGRRQVRTPSRDRRMIYFAIGLAAAFPLFAWSIEG